MSDERTDERHDAANTPAPAGAAPPPPPRALGPAARRRAWAEPHVRFWCLLTLALLAGVGYLAGEQLVAHHREAELIRNGATVSALVRAVQTIEQTMTLPGHAFPPDATAYLRFEYGGTTHEVAGKLAGRTTYIVTGDRIPLHVDPNDPEVWTARTEPAPVSEGLLGPLLALPAAAVAAAVALRLRSRALRTWRTGVASAAAVVDTQPSPLAPARAAARCTLVDGDDPRVFTVYLPRRVRKGDVVWVVTPAGKPSGAVAAEWFA